MSDFDGYEITAAVGKQVAYMRVYREGQDRQLLIGFTDGTELTVDFEVTSVTAAVHYQPTPTGIVPLERFDEPPAVQGAFSATIRASTKSLE